MKETHIFSNDARLMQEKHIHDTPEVFDTSPSYGLTDDRGPVETTRNFPTASFEAAVKSVNP
jgi:hypothetical protein